MFIQTVLKEIKEACTQTFLHSMFLFMFIGVVIAPLIMFIVSTRNFSTEGQLLLKWSLLGIILLLMFSISSGFLLFRYQAPAGKGLSITSAR